jgi:hypothetical protein
MISLPPPEKPQSEELLKAQELVEAGNGDTLVEAIQGEDDAKIKASSKPRNAFKAIEIAQQVHQVQEWLTQGKRPNEIRRLCSEQWGLTTRVAEHRMHDARRQMVIDANVYDRQEKVGQMLQQLEEVLNQSLNMRQGSNAIGALRLQADLLQLLSRQN